MNSKLKPKIRFKGFTDDWEQRKLGEFASIVTGKLDANAMKEDGEYDFYTSGIQKYKIDVPAFEGPAITIAGNGATVGYMHLADGKFNAYQRTYVLSAFQANRKFLFFEIGNKLPKKIAQEARTGNIPYIVMDMLTDLMIFVSSEQEQKKVGEFMMNLDNLITLHKRKCDKLIELKKSLLEKTFPQNNSVIPEIRFKGFTDDWEQRKLKDFGSFTGGTSIESEFEENGKYKVISIGSYSETSKYNDQGIRCRLSEKTINKILNKDDLTMILNDKTSSGNIIGRVLIIDKSGEYVYNQRTERIEPDIQKYYPQFLYHMLNAPNIRKKIIKQSQGNTQIFVNWTGIQNLEYLVPKIDEQINLAKLIGNLDNLITLHQRKHDKLNKIKQSLLNDMFV